MPSQSLADPDSLALFFVPLFIIGPLTMIGTLLFGIMTMRARVFPRWLGLCLFVGFIVAFIDHFLPGNLATIAHFIANAGEWLFWLSFSAFGVVLLLQRSLLQDRPADMTVARDASPTDR